MENNLFRYYAITTVIIIILISGSFIFSKQSVSLFATDVLGQTELIQKHKNTTVASSTILEAINLHEVTTSAGKEGHDFFAATVRDLSTGRSFYDFNDTKRWPMASLTKLLTISVMLEQANPESEISISSSSVASEGVAGDLKSGERYSLWDLVKASILVSSNDAIMAMAESQDQENFIQQLQKKISDLGMTNTTIFDPTGLSPLNQSTIEDLMALVQYVYTHHNSILALSQEKTATITDTVTKRSHILKNINQFAGEPNFVGGKTGFIDEAGGNLISLFRSPENDHIIAIIVLGSKDRFQATRQLLQKFVL